MDKVYLFPHEPMQANAKAILLAGGSPEAEAELVSQRLVKANLTGHDSHGLIRLTQYMERVRNGGYTAGAETTLKKDTGSMALLSGNWGFGQPHANHAMKVAIQKAKEHMVAAVSVTDLGHIGRLADYACMAAEQGMIGLVFTATGGMSHLVAPFGGAARRMSTNPMCAAFPSDREWPVVMDFASSAFAEGKFRVMRDAKMTTPANVLINNKGELSQDPNDLYDNGAILPLGGAQGYKGYMLNFMMEVLGGLLSGGGFMGWKENPPFNNCSLMIVLNVSAFRELPAFKTELNQLIDFLKDTPSLEGQKVLYPGEKEAYTETKRRKEGIPLAQATVDGLQSEIAHYKLPGTLVDLGTESSEAHWEF